MSNDVDAWFEAGVHPLKDLMQEVRGAVLGADPRITESIKWKTPTFAFKGNIASINPQAKQFVSLMFHRGAEIPGDWPHLQGGGEIARYMRFNDSADLASQRDELQAIVRAWCALKDVAPASKRRGH
jgi:hypothetical protein